MTFVLQGGRRSRAVAGQRRPGGARRGSGKYTPRLERRLRAARPRAAGAERAHRRPHTRPLNSDCAKHRPCTGCHPHLSVMAAATAARSEMGTKVVAMPHLLGRKSCGQPSGGAAGQRSRGACRSRAGRVVQQTTCCKPTRQAGLVASAPPVTRPATLPRATPTPPPAHLHQRKGAAIDGVGADDVVAAGAEAQQGGRHGGHARGAAVGGLAALQCRQLAAQVAHRGVEAAAVAAGVRAHKGRAGWHLEET